ncbi:hypothetical protein COCSUDRAFT_57545 [Coccomyxa subellipsoidea C-169]|uniref:Uncharacterized protein n=1 Tax=Coccomyxa subellipsoidea (strain C-169) TaxID=574566 RepID=I0YPS8_COCSC|nr:hypothetical protein COCSUDRAFT_57545 [Coccomyxa subellipsoidea C-169]EIE20397.1 hypothetical protein COCSUDRAFT_57545 [Coccomyxa subellipsoidea C-169]|eukprot:XP_005644941.1 hypothetical protein COCSUDRAFT_57545 [Coccomyxa subellipsoidea C-169]
MSTECRAWRGSGFRLSPDSPRWLGLICLLPNGGARPNRGGLRGPPPLQPSWLQGLQAH